MKWIEKTYRRWSYFIGKFATFFNNGGTKPICLLPAHWSHTSVCCSLDFINSCVHSTVCLCHSIRDQKPDLLKLIFTWFVKLETHERRIIHGWVGPDMKYKQTNTNKNQSCNFSGKLHLAEFTWFRLVFLRISDNYGFKLIYERNGCCCCENNG